MIDQAHDVQARVSTFSVQTVQQARSRQCNDSILSGALSPTLAAPRVLCEMLWMNGYRLMLRDVFLMHITSVERNTWNQTTVSEIGQVVLCDAFEPQSLRSATHRECTLHTSEHVIFYSRGADPESASGERSLQSHCDWQAIQIQVFCTAGDDLSADTLPCVAHDAVVIHEAQSMRTG